MRPFPYNRRVFDRRGRYRWLQVAVVIPAMISIVLHTGAALWVRGFSFRDRLNPLTDAPVVETVLTLDPPRRPEPRPAPPPKPEPEIAPKPEPRPAPEARRERIEPRPEARAEPKPAPRESPAPVARPEPAPVEAPPPTPAPPQPPEPSPPARPASFAGVKADVAERVVYVVDASGAMTSSLSFVIDELASSIERLDESQLFQVVMFREPPPAGGVEASLEGYEMFRPGSGLVPATRANKDAAQAWAHTIRPLGKSSPLPGLTAALSLNPDLIFLLSRSIQRTGTEPRTANLAILKTLEDLNPPSPFTRKRAAVIKTIQFIEDDPSGLLQAIAARHGDGAGSYRLLSLEELTGR